MNLNQETDLSNKRKPTLLQHNVMAEVPQVPMKGKKKMESSHNFNPELDGRALLRQEVKLLAKRVDALIKWTEEFEDRIVFFGKMDVNNKEEKSNFESGAGSDFPSLVMACKLDEKDEDEEAAEEAWAEVGSTMETNHRPDNDEQMDLFGASCSFGELKGEGETDENNFSAASQNKISLLEWD